MLFLFPPLLESGAVSGLFTEALPGSGDFAQSVVPPPQHNSNLFASGQPGSRIGRFPSICAADPQHRVSGESFSLWQKRTTSSLPTNRVPEPKHLRLNSIRPFFAAHSSLFAAFPPSVCVNQCCISRVGYILILSLRVRVACLCVVCVRARVRAVEV